MDKEEKMQQYELLQQLKKAFDYTLNKSISISVATGLDLEYVVENFPELDKKHE